MKTRLADFFSAASSGKTWHEAVITLLQQMPPLKPQHRLGIVYITPKWQAHYNEIISFLYQTSGIPNWSGMVTDAVLTAEHFYSGAAAIGVLVLPYEESFYRLPQGDAIAAASGETVLMHIAPDDVHLLTMLEILNEHDVFPCGMIGNAKQSDGKSKRGKLGNKNQHVKSNAVCFSDKCQLATVENSGCRPLENFYHISAVEENEILTLDDKPALAVMKQEILGHVKKGDETQIFITLPITGSDSSKGLIRNITSIDNITGSISVPYQAETGDKIGFAVRDLHYSINQLDNNLHALKKRITGRKILAGLYIGCMARGHWLMENDVAEISIIHQVLGHFPILGCFVSAPIHHQYFNLQNSLLIVFMDKQH